VVFSLKAFGDKILKYFYVLGDILTPKIRQVGYILKRLKIWPMSSV
jgi:hypothetical protein